MTGVRRPGYNRGAGQILTTPLYQPACSEAELGAQLDERLRPAHEQIGRPAALRQQRDVHRLAELGVELQAGKVLEAEVAIEVDLGPFQPSPKLGRAAGAIGETDEVVRIDAFLQDCDPTIPPA